MKARTLKYVGPENILTEYISTVTFNGCFVRTWAYLHDIFVFAHIHVIKC
jgi:hypothetical protein